MRAGDLAMHLSALKAAWESNPSNFAFYQLDKLMSLEHAFPYIINVAIPYIMNVIQGYKQNHNIIGGDKRLQSPLLCSALWKANLLEKISPSKKGLVKN